MNIMKLALVLLIMLRLFVVDAQEHCLGEQTNINELFGSSCFAIRADDSPTFKENGFDYQVTGTAYVGELNEEGCANYLDAYEMMTAKSNKKKVKALYKQNNKAFWERTSKLREKHGRYLVNVQRKDSIGVLLNSGEFIYGDVFNPHSCEYLKKSDFKPGNLMEVPILRFKKDDGDIIEIDYDDVKSVRKVVMISVSKDSVKLSLDVYSRKVINGMSILVSKISSDGTVNIYKTLNYVGLWIDGHASTGLYRRADRLIIVERDNSMIHMYGMTTPSLDNSGSINKAHGQEEFDKLRSNLGEESELVKSIRFCICVNGLDDKIKRGDWFTKKIFKHGVSYFVNRDIYLNKVLIAEKI